MAPSEPHVEYSKNSWSEPGMAGITYEQFERGSIVPDGCQPGRFATCGGDVAPNAVLETLMAALDALDDDQAPPHATETSAPIEPEAPCEPEVEPVKPIPAMLARFWALKAEDARRKEERREATKQAKTREQARVRKQRQRAKERAAVAVIDYTEDELLASLETFAPAPSRGFCAKGWARQYDRRLAALREATANPNGDAFLIQMKGREIELVQGWVAQQRARESFGPKASLSRIAEQADLTKSSAQKLVKNIAKLEDRGRPWHGM